MALLSSCSSCVLCVCVCVRLPSTVHLLHGLIKNLLVLCVQVKYEVKGSVVVEWVKILRGVMWGIRADENVFMSTYAAWPD